MILVEQPPGILEEPVEEPLVVAEFREIRFLERHTGPSAISRAPAHSFRFTSWFPGTITTCCRGTASLSVNLSKNPSAAAYSPGKLHSATSPVTTITDGRKSRSAAKASKSSANFANKQSNDPASSGYR
jgi:hypothetical protein